jgi:hypothetical protein
MSSGLRELGLVKVEKEKLSLEPIIMLGVIECPMGILK